MGVARKQVVGGSKSRSYAQQPIDFGELSQAIRNLGLYWLQLNRVPVPD